MIGAPVRRVVIRDQFPVLGPEVFWRRFNRVVLAVAAVAALLQVDALIQAIAGSGRALSWFDHAGFAVVSLVWLDLGILVFLQRRGRRAGQIFLLFSAAGSSALAFGSLYAASFPDALAFSAGILLFPAFLFSFVLAFDEQRPWNRAELLIYLPPLVLIWPGAQSLAGNSTTSLWKLGLLCVALYLIACAVQAWRDLKLARTPEQAAQSRALVFGLIAGTVPGVVAFVIPIVLTSNVVVLLNWLPPIILLFLVAMSYAVLLFEFAEAELIVRRGIVYGSLTLGIVLAYGGLGALLAAGHLSVVRPGGGLSFLVVTILIGAAFSPIRRAVRRLVDWLLYGRRSDRWELLQGLSARLAVVMAPDELADVLVRELVSALHLRGAFLLRRGPDGRFEARHRQPSEHPKERFRLPAEFSLDEEALRAALGDPPVSLLLIHAKPITAVRRTSTPAALEKLDGVRAVLSIPLVTRSGLAAVLCLQPKEAHDAFDADDLELLGPIMHQATAALDNALLFARLEATILEVRTAYQRIAQEQETERARLAGELHDGTAQELAGLITLATVAERQMDRHDDSVTATLKTLRRRAEDAYQGVRRSSHALRPQMLDDFGLIPALERYLEGYQDATGIRVELCASEIGRLPSDVELAFFRVAQECLENVRKHSGAHSARVALTRIEGTVLLDVVDQGNGMSSQRKGGIGLAGMRERLAAVGGRMSVKSGQEGGVHVRAEIDIEEGADGRHADSGGDDR